MDSNGNPAASRSAVPDETARPSYPGHGGPNGMGTEGQAIGVVTMIDLDMENRPPNTRTTQEPDGEWLK